MSLSQIVSSLNPNGDADTDAIAYALSVLPEHHVAALESELGTLSDDAKEIIAATLEFTAGSLRDDDFTHEEVVDIAFAAFASAQAAVDSDCFLDDTTDAVEFIMDCIIEGERDLALIKAKSLELLNNS